MQHLAALSLALAASTDNFLVGLSEGLARHRLSLRVLLGIALANALGGWCATSGGAGIATYISISQQFMLAGFAFAGLAAQEYQEWKMAAQGATDNPPEKRASLALAGPMTLNNLAGGVTGGIMGISPAWNFFYVLMVSGVTMWVGYWLGYRSSSKRRASSASTTQGWSVALYSLLALQSLYEAFACSEESQQR